MSWTNHLDTHSARVARLEFKWRLRRRQETRVADLRTGGFPQSPPARPCPHKPAETAAPIPAANPN